MGDDIGEDARVLTRPDNTPDAMERDIDGDGILDLVASFDVAQTVRNEPRSVGDSAVPLLEGGVSPTAADAHTRANIAIERR